MVNICRVSHICSVYCKGEAYYGFLPVPSSQKALLHVQADPSHRMLASKQLQMVNGQQEEVTQRRYNKRPTRGQKIGSITWNSKLVTPRELSQAENKRISDIIDRQR